MKRAALTGAALLFTAGAQLVSQVQLASLFSDHMVVQQGKPIHIWGFGTPTYKVAVRLGPDHAETIVNETGSWDVTLAPLPLQSKNAPLELTVEAGTTAITVHDVLVGEVWLASGQSNMVMQLVYTDNSLAEIASADHPEVRMFTVVRKSSPVALRDISGSWAVSSPKTAGDFSAVAYYFALKLQATLHEPIGIINSSWSGTPIKAWTSLRAIQNNPELSQKANADLDALIHRSDVVQSFLSARSRWEEEYKIHDKTIEDSKSFEPYLVNQVDWSQWTPAKFPALGADMQVQGGAVTWFRGEFDVDAATASKPQLLNVGKSSESTIVWVNGKRVGQSGLKPTDPLPDGLLCKIPAGLLHEGNNTIVLRIFAHSKQFTRFGSIQVAWSVGDPFMPVRTPLIVKWHRRTEVEFPPVSPDAEAAYPQLLPLAPEKTSTVLYHGLIEPLRDYSIAGAIWYQGEADAGHAAEYRIELPLMIADWRRQWKEEWPFYIVQLPDYGSPSNKTETSPWAAMREVEQQVAATIPHSGLAVTIDVGRASLLHPPYKRPVGERLGVLALADRYGKPVPAHSPSYSGMFIGGNSVHIILSSAEGLHAKSDSLPNFLIAGEDRKFYPANAVINGEGLVVSSPDVPKPIAVRYAFVDAPESASIYNMAELPLAPFRTDSWPVADGNNFRKDHP